MISKFDAKKRKLTSIGCFCLQVRKGFPEIKLLMMLDEVSIIDNESEN